MRRYKVLFSYFTRIHLNHSTDMYRRSINIKGRKLEETKELPTSQQLYNKFQVLSRFQAPLCPYMYKLSSQ